MIIEPLTIGGAFHIKPNLLADTRGTFARTYCDKILGAHGLNTNWVQMNTSRTVRKGTVRGMHLQLPPYAEVKLVRAVRGTVYDVVVDLRKGSDTFGQSIGVELDSANMETLYIPQGCAHGFQALSSDVELHYMHSAPYTPDHEGGVNFEDTTLNIIWPLPVSESSERDRALPQLSEIDPILL